MATGPRPVGSWCLLGWGSGPFGLRGLVAHAQLDGQGHHLEPGSLGLVMAGSTRVQSLLRLALGAALLCLAWLLLSASHAHAAEGTGRGAPQAAALSSAMEAAERVVPLASSATKPVSVTPVTPAAHAAPPVRKAAPAALPPSGIDRRGPAAIASVAKGSTGAVRAGVAKATVRHPAKVVKRSLQPVAVAVRAATATAPTALHDVVRAADHVLAHALPVARPVLDRVVEPVLARPSALVPTAVSASGVAALEQPVRSTAFSRDGAQAQSTVRTHGGSAARAATRPMTTPVLHSLTVCSGVVVAAEHATVRDRSVSPQTSGGQSAPRGLPPLPTEPASPVPSMSGQSASGVADSASLGSGAIVRPALRALKANGADTAVSAESEGPGSRPD